MFVNAKALAVIVSCALVAQAQSESGTATSSSAPASSSLPAGLDACIVGCASAAAETSGCVSYTNLTCVCTSSAFQQAAGACLQANCTTSDVQAAQQAQQQECAALSTGSSSASTATSTGTSASASATKSSAAMALVAPMSFGSIVGALITSAGALVGAALVL